MEVRRATETDRAALLLLLREFHSASGSDFPFDPARFDALFRNHLEHGLVLVLGSPAQGVLMATTGEHPFGMGKIAQESFWFVRLAARGRASLKMIDAYEAWAAEEGCVAAGMTSLAINDVSTLYQRRGFQPIETLFLKQLRTA